MELTIQHLPSGVVVVTMKGSVTPEEAREKLEELRAEYERWEHPHSAIFNVARLETPNAQLRQIVGDWRTRNAVLLKTKFYSGVYVVPSSILRGVLTAVNWIKTPDVSRWQYCKTFEEAMVQAVVWEDERRAAENS